MFDTKNRQYATYAVYGSYEAQNQKSLQKILQAFSNLLAVRTGLEPVSPMGAR